MKMSRKNFNMSPGFPGLLFNIRVNTLIMHFLDLLRSDAAGNAQIY